MENLVFEGFKFMALGMGTVFSFLIIMIIAMNLQSLFIHKFFPEPMPTIPGSTPKKNNDKAKIAAISAAIQHHKNVKG
ncbi:OadG family protein [Sulfurimonas sp. MAG313]|nr:OadG family protein [Sulfurimonas sp. MAG313]MDF1882178.1 OadG family protein [Sulfurimonas sp. MAG313]